MTDADAQLISNRLDNLESLLERIEMLFKQEITDLKTEQIAEIRKYIDRLADDQRRLWEAVRELEADRNKAHGGGKVIYGLITAAVSIIGSSAMAAFIMKFLK